MLTLNDLRAKAHEGNPPEGRADTMLVLDADEQVQGAVTGLLQYCRREKNLRYIQLILQGKEVGYLTKVDLYYFFPAGTKGVWESDFANLPGQAQYRLFVLRCPIQDCASRLLVMFFDEQAPPACPCHPEQKMELTHENG